MSDARNIAHEQGWCPERHDEAIIHSARCNDLTAAIQILLDAKDGKIAELKAMIDAHDAAVNLEHHGIRAMDATRGANRILAERAEALEARVKELAVKARKPFMCLFLDGRNEFGSHVLPALPSSLGIAEPTQEDLRESAEKILLEAEAKGYAVGDCVIALWSFDPCGYFEYIEIDDDLTALFVGSHEDQAARFREMEKASPAQ